jgi:cytochrome c oxidase subunit 2
MRKIIAVIAVIVLGVLVFSLRQKNEKVMAPTEAPQAVGNAPEKFTPPTTPPPGMASADVPAHEITIQASNWKFEPSEVRVREGERVKIMLQGVSGTHAIAIPELGVKSETVNAGETTQVEFTATQKGTFPFKCSFFCGEGHADMKGALIVE